ncbi:MAG: hypothetical protein H7318_13340 [Oligoflexus sp.]|nr:hypothetical protein [Oligoflexus sp.]
MCGIFAILRTSPESPQLETDELKAMARALYLKNTEGASYALWHSFLGLGQADCNGNRLEPLLNKAGTMSLVAEARLQDRSTWLRRLSDLGYQFGAQTDNEIILFAYEEYGPKCFAEFSGVFSVLIWDGSKDHIVAARDRSGLAPLYATEQLGRVYFASEIKSIFGVKNLDKKMNPRFFAESLLGASHPNSSPFLGFISIRPGTYVTMLKSGQWEESAFEAKSDNQSNRASLANNPVLAAKDLTPEGIVNNLHAYLWAIEAPVNAVKDLIYPDSRPNLFGNSPQNSKSKTRYGFSKTFLSYLLHRKLRNVLPPKLEFLDVHDESVAAAPGMSWKTLAATANGKIIFNNYLSLKVLDDTQIFSPLLTKCVVRLWKSSSIQSRKGRHLDALVGYILTCQILHRLFLHYHFKAPDLFYWEEIKPDRHLPPRSELFAQDHPTPRAWAIPFFLESKNLSDWDSFVIRHTHPGNFVVHFVSMIFFFGGPIAALITMDPLWLFFLAISGMVGSFGHFVFKDGKVSVKEATIQLMVPYFVLKMFGFIFRGKYGQEIKRAQLAYESSLGVSAHIKET